MDLRQRILEALDEGRGYYTMPMEELERRVGQTDLKPELWEMVNDGLLQTFIGDGLRCIGMRDAHSFERSVIVDSYKQTVQRHLEELL